jgi:hypothetical protein
MNLRSAILALLPGLRRRAAAGWFVAWLAFSGHGHAESSLLLKLDGAGRWVELTQARLRQDPGAIREPAWPLQLHLEKPTDATSPLLLQHCGNGTPIRRVTVIRRDASGLQLRITLEDAQVRRLEVGSGTAENPLPTDQITLESNRVEWSWFGPDGAHVLHGGDGTQVDTATQTVLQRRYPPFRLRLHTAAASRSLILTCPVEKGRSYAVSGSREAGRAWETLDRFTAEADGVIERTVANTADTLFLRVEALD